MLFKLANAKPKTLSRTKFGAALVWIAAWVWTIVAGGGGLWLLWTKGPWSADQRLVRAVFRGLRLVRSPVGCLTNTGVSRSQVRFGLRLLLGSGWQGELLWPSEFDVKSRGEI